MRNAKVKKSNKILAAITAAMLAVTIGGTGVTAFANNNDNTYECFSFSGENTSRSDFRRKDDISSCWCNCYNSSNSDSGFYIQVYGTSEHNKIRQAVTADAGLIIFQKTRHGICGM